MTSINFSSSTPTPTPIVVLMVSAPGLNKGMSANDVETSQMADALFKNRAISQSLNGILSGQSVLNVTPATAGLDGASLSGLTRRPSQNNNAVSLPNSNNSIENEILTQALTGKSTKEIAQNTNTGKQKSSPTTDRKELESKLSDLLNQDPTKPLAEGNIMDLVNNANPNDLAQVVAQVSSQSKLNKAADQKSSPATTAASTVTSPTKPVATPTADAAVATTPAAPPKKEKKGFLFGLFGKKKPKAPASPPRSVATPPSPRNFQAWTAYEAQRNSQRSVKPTSPATPNNTEDESAVDVLPVKPQAAPVKAIPSAPPAVKTIQESQTAKDISSESSTKAASLTQEQLDKLPKVSSELKKIMDKGDVFHVLKESVRDAKLARPDIADQITADGLLNGNVPNK